MVAEAIELKEGQESNPSLYSENHGGTGIWFGGGDGSVMGFSIQGTEVVRWTATGQSYNQDLTLDDNVKLLFGTLGVDGELSSDGTNVLLNMLAGADFAIKDAANTFVTFDSGADVVMYTRDIVLNDNVKLSLGTAGVDGDLYSDLTDVILDILGAAKLRIRDAGTDAVIIDSTGIEIDVDLNHDGSNVGFYGTTPAAQAAKISDPSGGATVYAEARTAINAILDALEGVGLSAAA